ncbi:RabGAP/TBC, partial [Nadsonia fulvescens var. elongata DSM 6958]
MVEFDPSLIISFETMDASPDILLSPSSLSPSSPASELSLIDTELHSSISSSTCPKSGAFAIDWEPLLLFEAEIINNNSKLLERDTDYINTSFLLARGDIGLGNRTTVTDTQSCDNFTKESETVRKNEKTTSKPISDITALKNLLDSYQNLLPFIESKPVSDFNLAIWGHIINDFPLLASKVPHVVTKLVHEGIPPALRGHIWKSFIFSEHPNDKTSSLSSLSRLYNALAAEWTPDLKLIAKDLYRSFPDVEIFKERDGPGQTSLGKVLRAYSAYDIQLGYCQGLAFLVGPLLMHMND